MRIRNMLPSHRHQGLQSWRNGMHHVLNLLFAIICKLYSPLSSFSIFLSHELSFPGRNGGHLSLLLQTSSLLQGFLFGLVSCLLGQHFPLPLGNLVTQRVHTGNLNKTKITQSNLEFTDIYLLQEILSSELCQKLSILFFFQLLGCFLLQAMLEN